MGRIIFNIIGFAFLGLIAAIVLLVIMFNKKVMTRSNSTYKILIRVLYIPFIVIVCIYSFGNFGFIRGVYQVISKENPRMVNGIYGLTVKQFFSTEAEKNIFLKDVKSMAQETEKSGLGFADRFEEYVTGSYTVDSKGHGFISKIAQKYNKEIYKSVLNGLFYAADSQFNTETDHEKVDKTFDVLYSTDLASIEKSIKISMEEKVQEIIDKQYHSALLYCVLFWLILMSIPFIEFFIYKKWIENTGTSDPKGLQQ